MIRTPAPSLVIAPWEPEGYTAVTDPCSQRIRASRGGDHIEARARSSAYPHSRAPDACISNGLTIAPATKVYVKPLSRDDRWHRAYLDGNCWVGPFPVFHKKESGEIRQLPERVQGVIDVVAGRMAEPAPTQEELGSRQYYIERGLIDCCSGLLCWPSNSDEGFSKQELALFRAVLMAAAAPV